MAATKRKGLLIMSHKHNPPRQNVHRGRAPVTTPDVPSTPTPIKASSANAAINKKMAATMQPTLKLTPAQAAVLKFSGSKTY